MRLKLQMGAAPGILEKDLAEKIRVEESVCKVFEIVENDYNALRAAGRHFAITRLGRAQ